MTPPDGAELARVLGVAPEPGVTFTDLGELVVGMDGLEHGGAFLLLLSVEQEGYARGCRGAHGDRVSGAGRACREGALGSAAHESNGACGDDERTGECPG